jgi:hypothetical protein
VKSLVSRPGRVKSPTRGRKKIPHRLALPLVLSLALAACAPCRDAELAQLYFGRTMTGGGEIDEAAWDAFVAAELAPRFPDGFTVVDAAGRWRDPATGAVVQERTKLVQIAAPASAETASRIEAVRAAYRTRFAQRSVGLVTAPACADF